LLQLDFDSSDNSFVNNFLLPFREMAAYEALWTSRTTSFKKLSELFASKPNSLPSSFVDEETILKYSDILRERVFSHNPKIRTNLLINSTLDYPSKLRDAKEPVEVLYFSGNLNFLNSRSVAVVGSRKPSKEGLIRTNKIVKLLIQDGFTIASGLAEGIDTEAHKTAISNGGRTIAVIGTPLNEYYPKQNAELQNFIANEHLLISQVPFIRYSEQTFVGNKLFFPERNKTMSAITEATIIIEASDTSGTLIQARAALHQNRKLFILQSCFENPKITWPKKFVDQGAIRVVTYDDIQKHLGKNEIHKD
jgi:DNA processing protein